MARCSILALTASSMAADPAAAAVLEESMMICSEEVGYGER